MTHVVFALGTNIGNRIAHLRYALQSLEQHEGVTVEAVSSIYETEPVGGPNQENYLNAVITAESKLSAADLLHLCHEIENERQRTREVRWGPRTLDVDLLIVGDVVSDDPALTLPHPRAHERGFVLVPWASIDPLTVIPGHGTVHDCAARVGSEGVWLSQLQWEQASK